MHNSDFLLISAQKLASTKVTVKGRVFIQTIHYRLMTINLEHVKQDFRGVAKFEPIEERN